jgi:mRNA interferase MazF
MVLFSIQAGARHGFYDDITYGFANLNSAAPGLLHPIQSEEVVYYMKHIRRGEIYNAALGDTVGSEQGGLRPVLILQHSRLCRSSPTVIVAPITSHLKYPSMRAHHVLDERCPLHERSMVLTEQIRAIDKRRLGAYIGRLQAKDMLEVGKALRYSLGLAT